MRAIKTKLKPVVLLVVLLLLYSNARAQDEDKFKKAQWLFQHENYEQALPLLTELRTAQPQSSEIAYELGMTYKRLQDFQAARPHLEAAATLQPKVRNAFLELIDLLYQSEDLDEAKKWIEAGEKESVDPSQLAFFKGLILLKEGKDPQAALESLEKAEQLNPTLGQTVKYQKALAYVKLEKFKEAKTLFREIIAKDPTTDLAKFASEYMDAITRREEAKQPFHGSLGYSLQYDDNVVFKPTDDALATGISNEADWKHVFTAKGEYNYKVNKNFGIKTGANLYKSKHNDIGFYDVNSYDFPVQPTFYFKKSALAFPINFDYVDVNNKKYLTTMGYGTIYSVMVGTKQMAQLQLQYNKKNFHWADLDPADIKSSREYLWGMGWFYFFDKKNQGFFNLRYAMNYDDTKGNNWRYTGNRLTFSSVVPLVKKLKWSFVGDYCRQDFGHKNTVYNEVRHDNVYTVIDLLSYEIFENTELQLEHCFMYDDCDIGVYKFKKNTYGMGVKYRF